MAAPIVIPQGENPITQAIQYAGKAVRDSIGLMNQAKQIQVMQDANRIDSGKALLQAQWNMFDSLSKDLGPEAAWDKTKFGFASAFKFLGMDDTNIEDFNNSMTSGPISSKGRMLAAQQALVTGGGSYRNLPPGFFSGLAQQDQEAYNKEQSDAQAATPDTIVTSAGKKDVTLPDKWITIAPNTSKSSVDMTNKPQPPALEPQNSALAGPIGNSARELIAKYDAQLKSGKIDQKTYDSFITPELKRDAGLQPQTVQPTTPSFTNGSPITTNKVVPGKSATSEGVRPGGTPAPTVQKVPGGKVTLIGSSVPLTTPEMKQAFIKTRTAEYMNTAGIGPAYAQMMAIVAADIPVTSTTVKGKPATSPAAPHVDPKSDAPPQWSPGLTSTPAWRDIKKTLDPDNQMTDEEASKQYKGMYEYWTRDVAGIDMKGANTRLGKQLASSLRNSPTLMDRVTDADSARYIATYDPSGRGDFAAGLKVFQQQAMHPEEYMGQTNRINANANAENSATQSREERAMNDVNQGLVWNSIDPLTSQYNGQKVNLRQYALLEDQSRNYLGAMASEKGGPQGEMYITARKNIEDTEKTWREWAMKQAPNNVAEQTRLFNMKQEAELKGATSGSYVRDKSITEAYEEANGWKKNSAGKLTWYRQFLFFRGREQTLTQGGTQYTPNGANPSYSGQPADQTSGQAPVDNKKVNDAASSMGF